MGRRYEQLSYEERVAIRVLRKQGKGIREVSRELWRAPSTISRELKRNEQFKNTRVIYPDFAQMKANGRRRRSYRKERLKAKSTQRYVESKLKLGWSPMVISGRLRLLGKPVQVSHEAIYQYIYSKRPELRKYLARHHMRRKRFGKSKKFRVLNNTPIPQRISINERPLEVEARAEIGHWEGDLITSTQCLEAIQVLLERKSRRVSLSKIANKTAKCASETIIHRLRYFAKQRRRTITYDNGKENSEHYKVNSALGTQSFFADPYASWQKGSVENVIGIVRRTYPKKTNLSLISDKELKILETKINSTPRRSLHFRTPMEVFRESGVALHC